MLPCSKQVEIWSYLTVIAAEEFIGQRELSLKWKGVTKKAFKGFWQEQEKICKKNEWRVCWRKKTQTCRDMRWEFSFPRTSFITRRLQLSSWPRNDDYWRLWSQGLGQGESHILTLDDVKLRRKRLVIFLTYRLQVNVIWVLIGHFRYLKVSKLAYCLQYRFYASDNERGKLKTFFSLCWGKCTSFITTQQISQGNLTRGVGWTGNSRPQVMNLPLQSNLLGRRHRNVGKFSA